MEIVIRAAIILLFLFTITRVLGKGTLGELNTFELITLVVVADLIEPAVMQEDQSLVGSMLAVSTSALLAAREEGIRDLREVELAVLEVDDKISFLQRWDTDSTGLQRRTGSGALSVIAWSARLPG